MRALVVGGYGLIGAEVVRRLAAHGFDVVGAGRDLRTARRRLPGAAWVQAELGRTDAAGWAERLAGVDVVVNAAGVLQDGWRESLEAAHGEGPGALLEGCRRAGVRRLVHVSAAGVAEGRPGGGPFNAARAEAERRVAASGLDWVVLRPGLVLGPEAFGGSGLLRGLAGFPLVVPAFAPGAAVQVVSLRTVGEAAARAARPGAPSGAALDLTGAEAVSLATLLRSLRAWLGLAPAPVAGAPRWAVGLAAAVGDGLGRLGWRSPVRSNAVAQLALGMDSPGGGEAALGLAPERLDEVLAAMPATLQERRYARLYFAKPALLIALTVFCALTGLVALVRLEAAAGVLTEAGLRPWAARVLAGAGAAADLAVAAAIAFRPTAMRGLQALVALTVAYLAAGSVLRPDLWADPLGPLTKTVLVGLAALVALGFMDER